MKLSNKMLIIGGFLLLSSNIMADSWSSYFPPNKQIKAKVMELAASAEVNKSVQKLQKGVAEHQEWFKSYIKDRKPGEILPYHKNMGITENEYKIFLDNLNHVGIKQIGTVDVSFQQEKDGSFKIKTEQKSPIDGLIIGQQAVTTPFGKATKYSIINNSDKNAPTGPWKGVQWSLIDFDEQQMKTKSFREMKGKDVKLAVGKLSNTGEGILYYNVNDIDMPKDKKVQISYIIFYPLNDEVLSKRA
ncbi:MAG: hypothetical protein P4L79_03735 [Legionella sp.]|uniref:hypothetical protein n=1 Tax=Legionella sp. TaxID=459 RepID=UPI00283D2EF6|nr:hypothetical protein [Legionella sp.]